ncbi:MAG: phage tail family protein [Youngiibacter sp.]|nr:phage tail family protein [Youngiibacter sp.]
MGNSITFKGISSNTYGLIVNKLSPIQKAEERGTYQEVAGRDGYLFIDSRSYAPVDKEIVITTTSTSNIDSIKNWLTGEGDLTLSSEPDVFYKARVFGQINFERLVNLRQASTKFRCQPFGYLYSGLTPVTMNQAGTLTNIGTAMSEPVIKVNGSGNIILTVNSKNIILSGVDGYVTLNSEIQECYKDLVSKNSSMQGEFPIFEVGTNNISWTGTVTSLEITPNWRNL